MHPITNPEITQILREIYATLQAIQLLRERGGKPEIIALLEQQLPTQLKQLRWSLHCPSPG